MPVSMSADADVNRYIRTINSDYSYQLAELTLFQFPNTTESKLKNNNYSLNFETK